MMMHGQVLAVLIERILSRRPRITEENAAEYPPALCQERARCVAVTQPVVANDAWAAKSAQGKDKADP